MHEYVYIFVYVNIHTYSPGPRKYVRQRHFGSVSGFGLLFLFRLGVQVLLDPSTTLNHNLMVLLKGLGYHMFGSGLIQSRFLGWYIVGVGLI